MKHTYMIWNEEVKWISKFTIRKLIKGQDSRILITDSYRVMHRKPLAWIRKGNPHVILALTTQFPYTNESKSPMTMNQKVLLTQLNVRVVVTRPQGNEVLKKTTYTLCTKVFLLISLFVVCYDHHIRFVSKKRL